MSHSRNNRPRAGTISRRSVLKTSLAIAATGTFAGISRPAKSATITLRFGNVQAPSHANSRAQDVFKTELEKLSGGQLKVENYPNGQLGGIRPQVEATKAGIQEMVVSNPAMMSTFAKDMDVMNLLFLPKSQQKVWDAVEKGELGKRLASNAEASGFVLLGWWALGGRNFLNNKRPINVPDDLKGLKMRVQVSPVWVKSMQAMGANPISMDFVEVYGALQTGVIDGYENLFADVYKGKFYEVVKYMSLSEHQYDLFNVFINKSMFDGLTADQQNMIRTAMKTATDWQRKAQEADQLEAQEKLKTLLAMNEVSPENRKLFAEKCKPVWVESEARLGKDLVDLAIKEMG
jgi:tripartite ATP-independent transporter DctP family solute receptor